MADELPPALREPDGPRGTDDLHADLKERIAALEDPACQGSDFDAASWAWLILFGVAVPLALLIWGWGP